MRARDAAARRSEGAETANLVAESPDLPAYQWFSTESTAAAVMVRTRPTVDGNTGQGRKIKILPGHGVSGVSRALDDDVSRPVSGPAAGRSASNRRQFDCLTSGPVVVKLAIRRAERHEMNTKPSPGVAHDGQLRCVVDLSRHMAGEDRSFAGLFLCFGVALPWCARDVQYKRV